jgi:hypothetical protein
MMANCVKCAVELPTSDLLMGPEGSICQSCNLDDDVDALVAAGLMKRALAALVLAWVGGPVSFTINGINVVLLVTCPIAIGLAISVIVGARKAQASKALAVAAVAILSAAAWLAMTALALVS